MSDRLGLWIVGSAGNVGTATALGLLALRRSLIAPVGLLTAPDAPLAQLPLAPLDAFVIGGHELRTDQTLADTAATLVAERIFSPDLIAPLAADLAAVQREVRRAP
jgi:hypothetical protein